MPSQIHRLFRRHQAAWLTLAVGLALTAALGWELHREAVALDRQRLAMRVAEITAHLDARLEKSEMLLQNLRDYLTLSGENRNEVFDRWCYENGLTINCKWIHGILVATNRNMASWPEQVSKSPKDWTTNDWNAFVAFSRTLRIECDIALQSSLTNTKRFLTDYDLKGTFSERKAFPRTVGNSRLGMSKHRTVMLDAQSNTIAGTCFQVPIYRPEIGAQVAEVAAAGYTKVADYAPFRWLHFTSVIVAPVDFSVLAQSIWDGTPADAEVELFSSTNQTAETWLNPSKGIPRAADPTFKAYLTQRQLWPMYGHRFSLFFCTTPLFEAQSPRRMAKVAVAAGTILTLLASALIGVALRARNVQELMTEQILEARDALAAAQQERNKISRDLHDGTIQSLYAIQLGLGRTVEKLKADPAKAGRGLSAVRKELDTVIAEIRQFITAETVSSQPVDFGSVLQALVQRARTGATAEIALQSERGASERLTGDQAVQLANIARESLSNSLRHSKPQRVRVVLRSEGTVVLLQISDDGAGFDPKARGRSGVGLASMLSRAREVGGTFEIQSSPGKGTCIEVRVPTRSAESVGTEGPAPSPSHRET